MAIKKFPLAWIGVYRASSNSYHGGKNILVGGSADYQSYIGIPTAVRDAIKNSRTTPKLRIKFNVTDGAEFDFGAHKETNNKASGTMPYYNYIGLHPILSTGWQTVDLTADFLPEYRSGSRQGIVIYGGSNYGEAYGLTDNSNEAYFEVEGSWNAPPSKPTFKTPVSSTIASGSVLVSWTPATDQETAQDALTYNLRFFDGTAIRETWHTVAGATSHSYPLTRHPETSGAYFEIRSYDGEDYSDWVRSPTFSVAHNLPPSIPTQLSPSGGKVIDRNALQRFTWKHNDDGVQAGYRIAWRTIGGSWNYYPSATGFANSISQYHDYAPNTFPLGEMEWTVKTMDQQGLESPYSQYQRFVASLPTTAPIFLTPQSGSIINTSRVTVEWSSVDQGGYELEFYKGNSLVWSDSGFGSIKRVSVDYPLENNSSYSIKIRVSSVANGLWSPWSTSNITTQFTPPAKPNLVTEPDENGGTMIVSWSAGTPATATVPVRADLRRREYNSSTPEEWEVVAQNQLPNDVWIDYTPASDKTYEYQVTMWGENATSAQSDIVEGEVLFSHAYLHRASTLSDTLLIDIGDSRDQEIEVAGEAMFFSNRRLPVYEFGFTEQNILDITFIVESPDEYRTTLAFITRKETFLYRDNNGRRFYCILRQPKIKDLPVNGFEFTVQLLEVDYVEVR